MKDIPKQNEKSTKFISCWLGRVVQGVQPAGDQGLASGKELVTAVVLLQGLGVGWERGGGEWRGEGGGCGGAGVE